MGGRLHPKLMTLLKMVILRAQFGKMSDTENWSTNTAGGLWAISAIFVLGVLAI